MLMDIEKKNAELDRLKQRKERLEKQIANKQRSISNATRKQDAHQKILLGGAVLSILGRAYAEGDEGRLIAFLKSQEERGQYFSKAMALPQTQVEQEEVQDELFFSF